MSRSCRQSHFILTSHLLYDNLSHTLRIKSQFDILPIGCVCHLIREAGERPALSRSCNAESTSICHWETGKARKTRKQSQKNCPIGTLYRPCERQEGAIIFMCFVCFFAVGSKKAFCLLFTVCLSCALFDDASILLTFWKQNVNTGITPVFEHCFL